MSNKHSISKSRYSKVKKTYGLEPEEYNNLLKRQQHKCAICGVDEADLKMRLHVDHDHKNGHVRGLLCTNCNVGLGNFKDSQEFLLYALLYLQDNE